MSRTLDSKVFFAIPGEDLDERTYKLWFDSAIISPWLLKEGNHPRLVNFFVRELAKTWNQDYPLNALYNGKNGICKFRRTDDQWAGGRGVIVRDHYDEYAVARIRMVADSLEAFLQEKQILYKRQNFER